MFNSVYRLPIIYCGNSVSLAGEEWGENEKDWVEKVGEKIMAAVFSYDVMMGAGRLFVFLPRKSNLVDYLG